MASTDDDFSRAFYPFMHEDETRPAHLMAELRFSLTEKAQQSAAVKIRFFQENCGAIISAARAIARVYQRGGKMLVCGNGGSATDAQHIAVEFMHPIVVGRKALPAICLANDITMITAVANDVGYDDIFSRQLIALAQNGDLLLGISTSGNSENLIRAFETAHRMKLITIGCAGIDGGKMAALKAAGILDHCLTVASDSIHRIQETHVALYHILWDLVHTFLQHGTLMETDD